MLHSRLHEVWARALGTQLRERESGFRYTPTTCFETFPFPELGGDGKPGSTGILPVSASSTGFQPVIDHGQDGRATCSNHGQDARATCSNHGQDGRATCSNHGQDARATNGAADGRVTHDATARIPADGLIHIRQGARLPHWTLEGATYFVTFRLGDSLPPSVLESWVSEKAALEQRAGEPARPLTEDERSRLAHLASEKVEAYLDAGHGSCCLAQDAVASVVQNALLHFTGERYDLLAWSVMPNHVHAVVQPKPGYDLPAIVHSWKSFTGNKVNALVVRQGELWQPEYYDHLVRDVADLERCIEYTYTNPDRAGLTNWRWRGICCGNGSMGIVPVSESSTGILPVSQSGSIHGQDGRATNGATDGRATNGRVTVQAIAAAAKELDALRNNWLNPPEWTCDEVLEFPGSTDGPWAPYVHEPDDRGIGTVRYPRIVPKDADCEKLLKKRTLTNLYNERPTWLDLAHRTLDEAVFAAYGWEPGMSDDDILAGLLDLNLARAEAEAR